MQPKTQELEATFNKLAEQIKRDAGLSSRISDRVEHPAYQQVIKMGEPVLPLIFRYMDGGKGGFWFDALCAITGENPMLPPERLPVSGWVALDIKAMEQAWLQWAREQGYQW